MYPQRSIFVLFGWNDSREKNPKPNIPYLVENSTIQETKYTNVRRMEHLTLGDFAPIFIRDKIGYHE